MLREIQSTSSTASSVAEIASSDPSLAASLLRAVNSAAFGLPQKVTSVSQAVALLGFGAVRVMVVRFRLEAMMPTRTPEAAAISEDIWTHSLAVSYIAAVLAARVPELDRGFISTLGLLHDIGRLARSCSQHPDFAAALGKVDTKVDSVPSRETAAFGADHAAVGALLGNKWKLPADLNTAIRWHHSPAGAFEVTDPPALRKAVHIVHIANQLAKFCFSYSQEMEIDSPTQEALEMLRTHDSLAQLLDAKVRAAATQAILYALENTKRPLTLVRPFLHLRRGADAAELLERLDQTATCRVTEGPAGSNLIDSSENSFEFNENRPAPVVPLGGPAAQFSAPANLAAADWLIKSFAAQLQSTGVPIRTAGMSPTR